MASDSIGAMPQAFDDPAALYRYDALYRYFVLPEAQAARRGDPSVISGGLATMFDYFSSLPRPDLNSALYALPDYDEFVGTTMVMRDCAVQPRSPRCNDPEFSAYSFGAFIDHTRVVDVAVDAENAGKISAQLNADGSVTVSRKPGFFGYAYFDYRVESSAVPGQISGRYYLRSRP
jgi:hypothetical protein